MKRKFIYMCVEKRESYVSIINIGEDIMILKMKKVPYTFNVVRKEEKSHIELDKNGKQRLVKKTDNVEGSADFGNHIYYNVRNEQTGRLCENRCDMFMGMNPRLTDFGQWLKSKGKNLSPKELKAACFEEAERQKNFLNERFIFNKSPLEKYLDEHGECLDTKKLFMYKLNVTFTKDEYNKMLEHCNRDKFKTKMMMKKIKDEIICSFFNQIKRDQKIGQDVDGWETTIEDLIAMDNFHIKGEANPHIHSYMPPFDPVTNRLMNCRDFRNAKKMAHLKIEKKYKEFLLQGIAEGMDKIEGKQQRREYLRQRISHHNSLSKGIADYRALQALVKQTYAEGLSNPEKLQDLLKANGIREIKANKNAVNLAFESSTTSFMNTTSIFNIESFRDPKLRKMLRSYGERKTYDENTFTKVHEVEKIVKSNYDNIVKQMNDKLSDSPESEHKRIRKTMFKVFARRMKKDGLMMDLTKQGGLSYIVMSTNNFKSGKNLTLSALKSSLMVNELYHGKTLLELFSLESEDIEQHNIKYMSSVPKSIRYGRKRVHIVQEGDEDNTVKFELFRQKMTQDYLKYLGAVMIEQRNGFVLKKGSKPLMKVTKGENDSCRVSLSDVYPKQAAALLLDVFVDQSKNLQDTEVLRVFPVELNGDYQHLRELHIKLLFSTDKNTRNIVVEYPMMENDSRLKDMIANEVKTKIVQMDKKHNTCYKRIKNKSYNFTESMGISLLGKESFVPYKDEIEQKLNEQIIDLVVNHNVKEIKFNRKIDAEYFIENKGKLYELSQSMDNASKKKLDDFYKQFTNSDSTKPVSKQVQDETNRNRIRNKL
ncbi:hypothetical protein L0991_03670 [Vibrio chagasii]|uniref:hypothetical protein n=1 Tax=Vibrio chagasii TaxID=170679 RepID=UPI0035A5B335